jgi:hypothetical protein
MNTKNESNAVFVADFGVGVLTSFFFAFFSVSPTW